MGGHLVHNVPQSRRERTELKVGDHVCVHKSFMGGCHLPCRIVWEFDDGHCVLYCAKGILSTLFCTTELVPLPSGAIIAVKIGKGSKEGPAKKLQVWFQNRRFRGKTKLSSSDDIKRQATGIPEVPSKQRL